MIKILFPFLLGSIVYNYNYNYTEEYVTLPKYGSVNVTRGYIDLDINDFKKGDKITIEIMIDSRKLPSGYFDDDNEYTLLYIQENSNSREAFNQSFNLTSSKEDQKSSSVFHYFTFKIKLEKKTKYLLFKAVYFHDAPITVKHLHKTNTSISATEIVFIIIFICIIAVFIFVIYCVIKRINKNSEPKPQISDTPLIPSDDNNPNYETPYYEK